MVASRWNDQTSHFEASVVRDLFAKALGGTASDGKDSEVHERARYVWMRNWINKFGDKSEVWIEIPEAKISNVTNPTGHSVLCWSAYRPDFNGVLCFIPYQPA